MKAIFKKAIAFVLVIAMAVTASVMLPQSTVEVQAAKAKVYVNPYSAKVVTYKPDDGYSKYSTTISIMGCTKKSQIKKLKSSNKAIKVSAKNGYIQATFGDKAGKTTITCTVKGVKLKTTLTVKKYTNPCKSIKVGKQNLTSKFKNTDVYRTNKGYKNQTLNIKMNKGWKISSVYVYKGGGSSANKRYNVNNKSSFSKKITVSNDYGYVYVSCYNEKTKISEWLEIRTSKYY